MYKRAARSIVIFHKSSSSLVKSIFRMDYFLPAKIFLLSLEVYPFRLIIPICTNHFPFVPTDFKPQPEPETMDSRVVELLTNPNQGNPVACHGRSSQVIPEGIDLVSNLKDPPQADEKFQRKIGMVSGGSGKEVGIVSIRESSQPKSLTCARRSSRKPLSSVEKFPKAGN
ncbi:hypothetical protein CsatB_007632 [Cannabis sativa]